MKLTMRKKLLAGFSLVLCIMALTGLVVWWYTSTLVAESKHLYAHNVQAGIQLGKAQQALWQLHYGIPQFLVAGAEERDRIIADEATWYGEIQDALKAYAAGTRTAAEHEALKAWQMAFQQYVEARPRWFELQKAGKSAEAAAWRAQTTTPYGAAAVRALGNLMALQEQAGDHTQMAVENAARQVGQLQLTLLVVAVLTGAGVATMLTQGFVRQVRNMMHTFRQISLGHYTARATVLSQDELGILAGSLNSVLDLYSTTLQRSEAEHAALQAAIVKLLEEVSGVAEGDLTLEAEVTAEMTGAIADAFNYMIHQLHGVVARVQEAAVQVSASANAVQTTAGHLAEGSTSQALQIHNSSAALEEMALSIQQVATNAALSASVAEQALDNAQQGSAAVQNTIQGMQRIRTQVQETAKRIKRLGERSKEIGDIIKLIGDISERTSIVALNASIQAARAGVAGRTFVVVAEEIERLAERSAAATRQITNLVAGIQIETTEAILAMEESTQEVVHGSHLADQAGQALGEIESVSARLVELIHSISLASQQQARGSEHLSKAMGDIADITQQTASGAKQAAVSITHLATLAEALQAAVSTFKIASTQPDPPLTPIAVVSATPTLQPVALDTSRQRVYAG